MGRLIERLAIVLAALAIAVGVIALLSGGLLAGRDAPGVSGAGGGPGAAFADQGDAILAPGEPRPVYDSTPPTSGPHRPAAVSADGAALSDDQLLQALQVGDVVLVYGGPQALPGLRALARTVAAPFSPALAASGQAVVLARRGGTSGVVALAWAHMLRAASASDPALGPFIAYRLGRGAPRHDRSRLGQ